MLGREAAVLIDGMINKGINSVSFDGSAFASGVYFYRIETEEFTSVKKMVLLK